MPRLKALTANRSPHKLVGISPSDATKWRVSAINNKQRACDAALLPHALQHCFVDGDDREANWNARAGDDVFVNVAGGMTIDDPAADLGIVAAIASSFRNVPVDELSAVFGEVGLAGEVRATSQASVVS